MFWRAKGCGGLEVKLWAEFQDLVGLECFVPGVVHHSGHGEGGGFAVSVDEDEVALFIVDGGESCAAWLDGGAVDSVALFATEASEVLACGGVGLCAVAVKVAAGWIFAEVFPSVAVDDDGGLVGDLEEFDHASFAVDAWVLVS